MKEIIKNDEFNVYRDTKKETLYKINFASPSYSLLRSIIKTNIIIGPTITEDYKSLTFQALSVKTLTYYLSGARDPKVIKDPKENLDIEKTLKMIYYLSTQLKYLINNEQKCFYRYNPDNILIIDETKFIYLSNDDLLKMEEKSENIEINTIISLNWFVSPEILKINTIPERVNYKTIYYSLGAVIIYCLYSVNILDNIEDQNNIEEIIVTIKGTKLYYFLKRCLNKTIENRRLIYF